MKIGQHDTARRVVVVAEIGNNHEGSFDTACRLVREAAAAGVDVVKFQTFQTRLFTGAADPARFERLRGFELSYPQFTELEKLARSLGLGFMSTPLDLESARFLEPLVDAFKIASGDNDFLPLIAQVAASRKPLIISTGLADLAHVRRIDGYVRKLWATQGIEQELAFLHCVCAYPVPDHDANLRAIPLLAAEVEGPIGYSDHTLGIDAALLSVALGARIIEKHFTLDHDFSAFRDHQLSADPAEMKRLVDGVRRAEVLLGQAEKAVVASEAPNAQVARRSIVAGADLAKGHPLGLDDLLWLRPAGGLPPGEEGQLVGRALARDVVFGEPLRPEDVR